MTLYPPSTLLIGPGGSGKTTSLVTLLKSGLSLRLLATEPSAASRVITEAKARSIPLDKFHHTFISPSTPKWDSLIESAKLVNTLSLDDIAKLRMGICRSDGTQWIKFLHLLANFPGLGDVTEWDDSCVLAIDGLTGISFMSRLLTIGLKPNPAPGEWGTMQNNILEIVRKLTSDCKCFFVLIAHVERELNEITGTANLTVSTLGAKLAPKLPPLFTNVIYAKREGPRFLWSTADANVDTKQGDLPFSKELDPDFTPIVTAYRGRLSPPPTTSLTITEPAILPHIATPAPSLAALKR